MVTVWCLYLLLTVGLPSNDVLTGDIEKALCDGPVFYSTEGSN
jgi:hypothetical protein